MVPEKYRLDAVTRYLLASWERRRPAIESWDEATEQALRADADAELAQMQSQMRELGMDDPAYWARVADAVRKIVIPRYLVLARDENALARRDYGLWRGGDLLARATFAAAGLVLGALAVAIPWIPVTEKWVPWALFVGGPFVPDVYLWWYRRRYQRRLERLVGELAQAAGTMELYRPLSEVQRALAGVAEAPAAAPGADESVSQQRTPTRT
jgi:hypothetical protein